VPKSRLTTQPTPRHRQSTQQTPPKAAARIAQCLLLALSSDKDGEIAAALTATRRALDAAGIDHHALASAIQIGLAAPPAAIQRQDWRDTARFCRSRVELLSEKEARFIATIMSRDQPLSAKQSKWLDDIEAKLRGWL
jgi:hypothetical protein